MGPGLKKAGNDHKYPVCKKTWSGFLKKASNIKFRKLNTYL